MQCVSLQCGSRPDCAFRDLRFCGSSARQVIIEKSVSPGLVLIVDHMSSVCSSEHSCSFCNLSGAPQKGGRNPDPWGLCRDVSNAFTSAELQLQSVVVLHGLLLGVALGGDWDFHFVEKEP